MEHKDRKKMKTKQPTQKEIEVFWEKVSGILEQNTLTMKAILKELKETKELNRLLMQESPTINSYIKEILK
ncbi:MAG: hypothetical protein WCO97_05515 [bacterium]